MKMNRHTRAYYSPCNRKDRPHQRLHRFPLVYSKSHIVISQRGRPESSRSLPQVTNGGLPGAFLGHRPTAVGPTTAIGGRFRRPGITTPYCPAPERSSKRGCRNMLPLASYRRFNVMSLQASRFSWPDGRQRTTFWGPVRSLKTCREEASSGPPRGARRRCTSRGRVPCPPCRATRTARPRWPSNRGRKPRVF